MSRPTLTDLSIGELCDGLRLAIDRIEEHNAEGKILGGVREGFEALLLEKMEAAGIESTKTEKITVTKSLQWRPKYDPERWGEIMQWCAESGNMHLVQRRLSIRPLQELIDNDVPLPAGLGVESFTKITHRRIN